MEVRIEEQVRRLIFSVQPSTAAKIWRTIDLLKEFGQRLSMPHSKKVAYKLFELRIRGQQEIRIFYCFFRGCAYLLHAFVKKSKKTPKRELEAALKMITDLTGI
ncbi:MAG: type II toxin-antitoxin system RelE/ParE family toxin [Candidatus Doudnabacteria bacterium]|nr:type II toxin-antitoxin system RelE/ParE family toxin [Candidatus Doudnabacteria bacterium]